MNFEPETAYDPKRRLRAERRKEPRYTISLPVEVSGFDSRRRKWVESTETINISSGGAALRLARPVMIGDILQVELPLPAKLRKTPDSSPIYKTYAAVRYIGYKDGSQFVRLKFIQEAA
ncbi:MAG TPA: PilZ domain-containing protein [Blastocatellia bacterium]|nr:PilZ domain-containing protein [Blastocatellia bacterium]